MGNFKELLERKPLSLVVSLPENDIALARAAMEEGADALKVHYNVGHRASGNHFGPLDMYAEVFRAIRSEFGGPLGLYLLAVLMEHKGRMWSVLVGWALISIPSMHITCHLSC